MGKYSKTKLARQIQASKDQRAAYITNLQSSLTPGLKLMTCAYCGKIVTVPEWQQMITCIRYGMSSQTNHPGEVRF